MYGKEEKILKDNWKPAKGGGKTLTEWMNGVSRMLNGFIIMSGGSLQKTDQGMILRCTGSGGTGTFDGTYYFKGKLYELTGDKKDYWYHDASTGVGTWTDSPMPDPMPDNHYWRKTSTCGAIEYLMC